MKTYILFVQKDPLSKGKEFTYTGSTAQKDSNRAANSYLKSGWFVELTIG